MKSNVSILKRAQEVLRIEAQAVKDQIGQVGEAFVNAVEKLDAINRQGGHVIVMGIGKSGLVGQKIAATLSSTGTPAIFFHPVEGLHGDLGMIRSGDGVLILSASGETEEIRKILPLLKERGLFLVGVTARKNSRLARAVDLLLYCPVKEEACPFNLTPTASTTAMLALGDALAITLMEKRGFQPSDFAKLHPGGTLGKKLTMTVGDCMRKNEQNPIVREDATVREALLEMTRTRAGATSVVNKQGKLVGFFTDGDLRRQLQKDVRILNRSIAEVMTKNPSVCRPEQTLQEALQLFKLRGFDNLPVVDKQGKVVGILDERDLLSEGLI